jgi:hypothetical protein
MIKSLYCLLLTLLPALSFAQNTLNINGIISWKDLLTKTESSGDELYFTQEFLSENADQTPFFVDQKVLKKYVTVNGYRFSAQEVTNCPENLLSNEIKSFTNNMYGKFITEQMFTPNIM